MQERIDLTILHGDRVEEAHGSCRDERGGAHGRAGFHHSGRGVGVSEPPHDVRSVVYASGSTSPNQGGPR